MPRAGRAHLPTIVAAQLFGLATAACNPGPLEPTDAGGNSGVDSETTEAPWEPIPARGIDILAVEANPGVGVIVAEGGTWRDGSERNARLPRGRDTLVRVLVEPHHGWLEREIEARLVLEHVDGEIETLSQTLLVGAAPSTFDELDSAFVFEMSAADGQVSAGVRFQVELWEVAEGAEETEPGIAVSPESGPELLGIEDQPMEMNVVFVPITYQGLTPQLDEGEKRLLVEDGLMQHNPLQRVNAQWHEPIVFEQPIENLGEVLPALVQLRNGEGKFGTNWFYAGLVETGEPTVAGIKGIAYRVGAEPEGDRVSVTVWNDPNESMDTLVHEVGHNQSFRHIFCDGQEADDLDPNYKNETGALEVWGYGIFDKQLRAPEGFEYMSYCDPSWVSDWTWNKAYYQIEILTGFDQANQTPPLAPPVLKAIVFPDGRGQWWLGPAGLTGASSSAHRLEIETDATSELVSARVQTLADSDALVLEAPLSIASTADIVSVTARTPAYEAALQRSPAPVLGDRWARLAQ